MFIHHLVKYYQDLLEMQSKIPTPSLILPERLGPQMLFNTRQTSHLSERVKTTLNTPYSIKEDQRTD